MRLPAPASLALIAAVVVATALALSPSPLVGEAGNAAQNALHMIGFFALTLLALYATRLAFPILEDGSGLFATHRAVCTYGSTTRLDPARDGIVLDVGAGRWPGLRLVDMHADWRGCETLVLDLTLDGDRPLSPILRLHDDAHDRSNADRFRRRITLQPGRNTVRVPMDDIERMDQAAPARRMALERMAGLMLFASPDDAGRILHVANVRLDGCG